MGLDLNGLPAAAPCTSGIFVLAGRFLLFLCDGERGLVCSLLGFDPRTCAETGASDLDVGCPRWSCDRLKL